MPIQRIFYRGQSYPAFQADGFAAQFTFPFAKHFCQGVGVDVGCGKLDWCFPGAAPIDPAIDPLLTATTFPQRELDYVFSSHCLEHLENWVIALEYWRDALKIGGVLFLYLPHPSQKYWLPWHNRKHIHVLHPEDIRSCLDDIGFHKLFISGVDLNNSYMVVGERKLNNVSVPEPTLRY